MSELVRISPNGTRVRTIPATVQRFSPQRAALHAKKRVAAYARVSTDEEEQLTSYEAQVDYYTRYIQANSDWELVEVYADEGISGTNTKKRKNFNRMIEDALAGKIDRIVTKSVSRFARNTVDCECQRKSEPSANQYLSHLCERILEPPTPKVTANT